MPLLGITVAAVVAPSRLGAIVAAPEVQGTGAMANEGQGRSAVVPRSRALGEGGGAEARAVVAWMRFLKKRSGEEEGGRKGGEGGRKWRPGERREMKYEE